MTCTSIPKPDGLPAIVAEIKDVLSRQTGKPAAAIRLEDDLLVDLGLDSLAIAELMTVLEQHLQRPVPVDELLYVATVEDLATLLVTSETRSARECHRRPVRETAVRV